MGDAAFRSPFVQAREGVHGDEAPAPLSVPGAGKSPQERRGDGSARNPTETFIIGIIG